MINDRARPPYGKDFFQLGFGEDNLLKFKTSSYETVSSSSFASTAETA